MRLAVLPGLCLCVLALLTGTARADGDPASDVLISQRVFVPYGSKLSPALASSLDRATDQTAKAGYPIRVALIASRSDLGAVPSLWSKPQIYSEFLGRELAFLYHGRTVVAMPNGLGLYYARGTTPPERRVVRGVTPTAGLDGLGAAALRAVVELAATAGRKVTVPVPTVTPAASSGSSSSTRDRVIIAVAAAAVLAAGGAFAYLRRRRRVT